VSDRFPDQHRSISPTTPLLPDIVWVAVKPGEWQLPSSALGWGLAHSRWHRQGMISHVDWFTVQWSDHRDWIAWTTVNAVRLFVSPRLIPILRAWNTVHAIGRPGSRIVLAEALAIETRLGCQ